MKNEFDEIWARIKSETNLKSLQSLANILKISQPAVSEMKGKGKFPPGWAYQVGKEFGLLTEWIMTGEGQKRQGDTPQNRRFDMLNEFEEWLIEEVRRNPERKIWFEIHLLDSFKTFAEWKRKRDEKESGEYSDPTRKVA
jgi:hypothetical protein